MADTAVTQEVKFDAEALGSIKSYADAIAALNGSGVQLVTTDDLGHGFVVLDDKDRLVKQPFVILQMQFNDGDFGKFVSLYIVTDRGDKFILNDGSTGIMQQCVSYWSKGYQQGIAAPRGLARSDYEYADDKGVTTPAKTYYLA